MELEQIYELLPVYNALAARANPDETLYFTEYELSVLGRCGLLVDADDGGILLAPSHDNGGIYFLIEQDGVFRVVGELEGWEFIINSRSLDTFFQEVELLNSNYKKELFVEPYVIFDEIRVINGEPITVGYSKFKRYLIGSGTFFIVNKGATKVNLRRLNDINEFGLNQKP